MKHDFMDVYRDRKSFIHCLDPRIKIIAAICCLVFFILAPGRNLAAFAWYAVFVGVLMALSGVPVSFYIKRFASLVPFVALIGISVPFMHAGIGGVRVFLILMCRAMLSIMLLSVLTASTRFSDLLKAGESLGFPKLLITVLSFMYRYIFLIQEETMLMKIAWHSRFFGKNTFKAWKSLAGLIAAMFLRSFEKAERVYLAMCSRGFSGQAKTLTRFSISFQDILFLWATILFLAGVTLNGSYKN